MSETREYMNRLLGLLVELLDIPVSYYECAKERYESLGEWFHREASKIADFDPAVSCQGSFCYGTVIRPLLRRDEYDLDLVCTLARLGKDAVTQEYIKRLVGEEVKAYAHAHGIIAPVDEGKRCWRLDYADDVSFHMDILPSVPEDEVMIRRLIAAGVNPEHAVTAIGITDRTHRQYREITNDWPSSNPRGLQKWFIGRMRSVAASRMTLAQKAIYASIDDVPVYQWKTPLQRAIQILKRHRDVMFKDNCELKPISMIITILSAQAYQGEEDVYAALVGIVNRMPAFVRDRKPRIANPVNPNEDFADRWDAEREKHFWLWHRQIAIDLENLASPSGASSLQREIRRRFALDLGDDEARNLTAMVTPAVAVAPAIYIETPARPWGRSV